MTSSPNRVRPKRNVQTSMDSDGEIAKSTASCEYSITLTAAEWKEAFSRTNRKMKSGWRKIFAKKLGTNGFVCTPRFDKPNIKKGERKQKCYFLICRAKCTTRICGRQFHIALPAEPKAGDPVLLLVRTYGEETHDGTIETAQLQMQGDACLAMG